jgi:hypothetical protein
MRCGVVMRSRYRRRLVKDRWAMSRAPGTRLAEDATRQLPFRPCPARGPWSRLDSAFAVARLICRVSSPWPAVAYSRRCPVDTSPRPRRILPCPYSPAGVVVDSPAGDVGRYRRGWSPSAGAVEHAESGHVNSSIGNATARCEARHISWRAHRIRGSSSRTECNRLLSAKAEPPVELRVGGR